MSDSHLALAIACISAACAMNLYLSVALIRRVRHHDRALVRLSPFEPSLSLPVDDIHVIEGEAELAALLDGTAR